MCATKITTNTKSANKYKAVHLQFMAHLWHNPNKNIGIVGVGYVPMWLVLLKVNNK